METPFSSFAGVLYIKELLTGVREESGGEDRGEREELYTVVSRLAAGKDLLGLVEPIPPNATNGLVGVIGGWEGGSSDSWG